MKDRGWFWFFSAIPSASGLVSRAEALARAGRIAPLEGVAADKVYLFSGGKDQTVLRGVVEAAEAFYRKAGVPAANIAFVKHPQAAHAFVTEEGGLACGANELTDVRPFLRKPPADFMFACDTLSIEELEWIRQAWSGDPKLAGHVRNVEVMLALRRSDTEKLRSLAAEFGDTYCFYHTFRKVSEAK